MDKEKLKDYFYSNIVMIFWSVFLLLGGGIFVAYFAHIEYMPDFDLQSSITITAAAAVTALMIFSTLLIVMVFPGIFWGNTWGSTSSVESEWTDSEGNKKFLGVIKWFAFPLVLVYCIISLSVIVGWYTVIVVVVLFGMYYRFFLSKCNNKLTALKEVSALFVVSFVTSVIIFSPLWMVLNLSINGDLSLRYPPWMAGITSGLFIIFINVMSTANPKNINPFFWYLALGVVTLFIIFSVFGVFHRVPVRVMEIYKFGNVMADDIILKENSCKAFRALEIDVTDNCNNTCTAHDILILSRLGREAYLMHGSEDDGIKLTVASEDIISWALRMKKNDKKEKTSQPDEANTLTKNKCEKKDKPA